ncbi:MAG: helix-turn-helix transcriptional regulator [Planctomycetaceae bacterium]|nr:helix-turn-helix transcriptional regulator [Planctomycetaceae bacterium]MCB9951424.1 helix-turn-helix transcriptional regulator [Planctomycetaceae bacterium]
MFECHGTPVKNDNLSDVYTNRPFGKVFQAIRDVLEYVAAMFREAGRAPFAPQAQAYTKRSVVDRIIQLHELNYPTGQIAAAVGLSGSTVSRHIQSYRQSLVHDSSRENYPASQLYAD